MLRRIAVVVAVLIVALAVPASAKPISGYQLDLYFSGSGDVLSIEFDDFEVTSVELALSCGDGSVLSYDSTSIDSSFVVVGPKVNRFQVSAQFKAEFTDCDRSRTSVTRFVQVSNFAATGATVRERDRVTGTRTLVVPVEADATLTLLPNQPLQGVLTEVISKG